MWVMQLIGRLAGSVVDIPFSAAENAIQNGTARQATDAEMTEAGVDTRQVVETADPTVLPPGYLAEITEAGGYDIRDAAGLPINVEPFPNLPAAISGAHEHRDSTLLPVMQIALDQVPGSEATLFTLADYRVEPVDSGGFSVFDPAGLRIGEDMLADEDAARLVAREHYAASRGFTLDDLAEEEAGASVQREVVIPTDWRSLHHTQRRALAQRITGEPVGSTKAADDVIEEYLTRP